MTASEKRQSIIKEYKVIIGRNIYSQERRGYVYKKYSDGKYYSDCSSSVCAAYKQAGMPIMYGSSTLPNTVGLYKTAELQTVDVTIKNGQITDAASVLRVGDLLLFAGKDSSRASAGYVGHVEMVYSISSGGKVQICGHGSGKPRITELTAYCKSRYNSKTTTKLGHRGLIRVRRLIADDGNIKDVADTTPQVDAADSALSGGSASSGESASSGLEIVPIKSLTAVPVNDSTKKYTVISKSVNVRSSPCVRDDNIVLIAHAGQQFDAIFQGSFVPIKIGNAICWISSKHVE